MPEARPLRAVICEPDPIEQVAVARAVEEAGFALLDEAQNGPGLLALAARVRPTLVVVASDLPGSSGLEMIRSLRTGDIDDPEVILITNDLAISHTAFEAGALRTVERRNVSDLLDALGEARILLETGERRDPSDRRSGLDRRLHQDWSKVTSERRSGRERRAENRRAAAERAASEAAGDDPST